MAALEVAVVGAGIVGLAHAWSAAERGHRVTLFERSARARGASIRNFGMIWPIGQPAGELHDIALVSRERWLALAEATSVWVNRCGSIHLAHRPDEWAVLQEFATRAGPLGYECSLLSPAEVLTRSPAARPQGLLGGLYSLVELAVNPRRALAAIPLWLAERYHVRLAFGLNVTAVHPGEGASKRPTVFTADGDMCQFDRALVCGGADVPLLFPTEFARAGLRLCKLQMLRTAPQPGSWRIGPHLAGGLTLRHYRNFEVCPALAALKARIAAETPELDRYGIHVMASQNDAGEVILGDSHEYGDAIEPFDKPAIDDLVLRELHHILELRDWNIAERWHGLYAKHPAQAVVELEPFPEIHLCTGTGGAGMTMAFGLAHAAWQRWTRDR
jgi:FAD dependent oxidoreductase TIGR03364